MKVKILSRRVLRIPPTVCVGLLFLLSVPAARPYSVLTHEAIIDSVWDGSIKVLLLERFPAATPEELIEAHAYAYGVAAGNLSSKSTLMEPSQTESIIASWVST